MRSQSYQTDTVSCPPSNQYYVVVTFLVSHMRKTIETDATFSTRRDGVMADCYVSWHTHEAVQAASWRDRWHRCWNRTCRGHSINDVRRNFSHNIPGQSLPSSSSLCAWISSMDEPHVGCFHMRSPRRRTSVSLTVAVAGAGILACHYFALRYDLYLSGLRDPPPQNIFRASLKRF